MAISNVKRTHNKKNITNTPNDVQTCKRAHIELYQNQITYPNAPCMVYSPTWMVDFHGTLVGKNTMEHLGYENIVLGGSSHLVSA